MLITDSFKDAINRTFMDKTVKYRPAVEVVGGLGSVVIKPADISAGSYKCNVQVLSDAVTAQEWGLTVGQDLKLTTTEPIPCERADYLDYSGKVYRIDGIIERDSHQVLMLKYLPEEVALV